ncbi:MAG: glucosaminidase domain-containing protein [Gammaproteobacteria bacterium]
MQGVLLRIFAFAVPVLFASLIAWWGGSSYAPSGETSNRVVLYSKLQTVKEYNALFAYLHYKWPMRSSAVVPAISIEKLPGDLRKIRNISERKSLFFRMILPIVLMENDVLSKQRAKVLRLFENPLPEKGSDDRLWLDALVKEYRVDGDIGSKKIQEELLVRLDEVPVAMTLAQAANESNWGVSRFTRLGNSLFGQWTYRKSNGVVPERRDAGLRHAVLSFGSIRDSVREYFFNLNVGFAYEKFREIRRQMRAQGKSLNAVELSEGLTRYSARGAEYVEEIQYMIEDNGLDQLQNPKLHYFNPVAIYSVIDFNIHK